MPTAAKMVAAVLIAVTALIGTMFYIPRLPDATPVGGLVPSALAIGALCGWMILGRAAGHGAGAAMGNGISTAAATVFWMLALWSTVEMVELSTKMRYDGPMDAVLGAFGLMVKYGALMLTPQILGTILIGGLVSGRATEAAARRWR